MSKEVRNWTIFLTKQIEEAAGCPFLEIPEAKRRPIMRRAIDESEKVREEHFRNPPDQKKPSKGVGDKIKSVMLQVVHDAFYSAGDVDTILKSMEMRSQPTEMSRDAAGETHHEPPEPDPEPKQAPEPAPAPAPQPEPEPAEDRGDPKPESQEPESQPKTEGGGDRTENAAVKSLKHVSTRKLKIKLEAAGLDMPDDEDKDVWRRKAIDTLAFNNAAEPR